MKLTYEKIDYGMSKKTKSMVKQLDSIDSSIKINCKEYDDVQRKLKSRNTKDCDKKELEEKLKSIQNNVIYLVKQRNKLASQIYDNKLTIKE